MVENIEKILERGDRIELLVDKTATMQDGAFHFRKQSKRLRRALWMKNAKLLTIKSEHERGPLDRLNCSVAVHNNCCCLWRHHFTFMQILSRGQLVLNYCSGVCGNIVSIQLQGARNNPADALIITFSISDISRKSDEMPSHCGEPSLYSVNAWNF
ncbi:hypothetical protein WN943_025965 [Citrus x changshan-huyou]